VDIDEPAHGIFLRAHTEVAQGDIAEDCEGQQAYQGDVEFDVQEVALENGGSPYRDNTLEINLCD
jgi:hypothetical protein